MTDNAIVVRDDAHLTTRQILDGLHTVKSVLAPDLSDDELRLFAMVANRSGLDPFAKQIYAVKRGKKVTFQTGIDGYRSIAARTGLYDGQDEPEYGPACACGDGKPAGHPEYATVRVYRKGVGRAIAATAYWHEYRPGAGDYDGMWVRMPRVMIGKVAEALALRKAFPYDPENRQGIGADVYTDDEMRQADAPVRTIDLGPKPTLADVARVKALQATQDGAGPREVLTVVNEAMTEPEATEMPVVVYADPEACAAQAQDGLMLGAVCLLPADHKGPHKANDGSWPR